MSYVYKPNSTRSSSFVVKKKQNTQNQTYIKTIIKYNLISLAIVTASFFAFVLIFSNIDSLWSIFKKSDVYVEEDKDKPAKPFLNTETEFTNKDSITLTGVAGEGQKVVLFKNNNTEGEKIADKNGNYSFENINITTNNDSETQFYTISFNNSNRESEPSNTVKVTYDNKKPKVTIEHPKNDDRIKSFSRSLEVSGNSDGASKITVNGKQARLNQEGNYSITIPLNDEVNVLKVEAEDKAGNKEISRVSVYFEKVD